MVWQFEGIEEERSGVEARRRLHLAADIGDGLRRARREPAQALRAVHKRDGPERDRKEVRRVACNNHHNYFTG